MIPEPKLPGTRPWLLKDEPPYTSSYDQVFWAYGDLRNWPCYPAFLIMRDEGQPPPPTNRTVNAYLNRFQSQFN